MNSPWVGPAHRQEYMQDLTWLLEVDPVPGKARRKRKAKVP